MPAASGSSNAGVHPVSCTFPSANITDIIIQQELANNKNIWLIRHLYDLWEPYKMDVEATVEIDELTIALALEDD
jgi:hypothetical protein